MKNNLAWIALSTLMVLACDQQGKKAEFDETLDAKKDLAPANEQLASLPQTDLYSDGKSKLIKTAHYRFQVESVKTSTEAIEAAVKKFPAYVSSSNLHLENPILENKITIRIQSEYFQELLKEIDRQAVFVNFRNISSDDVSKEFVDLESRIKTKREVEERYMEILRKKAGSIKELLEAEQQIGAIHEEIEATIGRLNYIKDQVKYSNINLEFYQTITTESMAGSENGLSGKFASAFRAGLKGVINFALALAYLWPLVIIGIGVGLIFKFKKKRDLRIKQLQS